MHFPKTFNKSLCATVVAGTLGSALSLGVVSSAQASGYEVVDVGSIPYSFSITGFAINDAGQFVGTGTNLLDNQLRTDLLDPEVFPEIEDLSDLNPQEWLGVRNWLNQRGGALNQPREQKLSRFKGFLFNGEFEVFNEQLDIIEPETGELTRSNDLLLYGLNNQGFFVGEYRPPFLQVNVEDPEDPEGEMLRFFQRDHLPLAAVHNGTSFSFLNGEAGLVYGGMARAQAINDVNQVVGVASVGERERLTEAFERCSAEFIENDEGEQIPNVAPLNACMYRFWASGEYLSTPRQPFYEEQAYLWELDGSGNVINQRALGVAFSLPEDEELPATGYIRSAANDINNDGIAVGVTNYVVSTSSQTYATVFKDGEATYALDTSTAGFTQSYAIAINDNGYMVGHARRFPLQTPRDRMFFKNVNSDEAATFPAGFFNDSSWRPTAINNSNIVVGNAERDRTQGLSRRTTGFMYNIDTQELTDLNTLLGCNSEYYVVDAMDINEHGEILALVIGDRSEEVNGLLFESPATYPVILRPSETVEGCGEESEVQERSGAFVTPIQSIALGLMAFVAFITRRKINKK